MKEENLKDIVRNRKGAKEILQDAIDISSAEYNRPPLGLLLSSFAAGMELSISLLVIAYISGTFPACSLRKP